MNSGFSYHSRTVKTGRRRLIFATIFVVVIFLLDLISGGRIRALVRDGTSALGQSAARIGAAISAGGYFKSHGALAAENAALKQEVASLQQEAALYQSLKTQNAQLASIARLATTSPGIAAPVASSFFASPYGTFLAGAGQSEGVLPGDLALTDGGIVIGKVASASAHTSLVSLLFASGNSLPVSIDGTPATAVGSGGGNAKAEVPHGITVAENDVVTAPQFENHPVGVVGKVISDPSSAQADVYIGLPVNLSSLQYIYIVRQ